MAFPKGDVFINSIVKSRNSNAVHWIAYSYIILMQLNLFFEFVNGNCYNLDIKEENIVPIPPTSHQEFADFFIFNYNEDPLTISEGGNYLKKYLKNLTLTTNETEEVSSILGNRPTALDLAAATLNTKKISIKDYINEIRRIDEIRNGELNTNEKEINKAMKIILNLVKNEEGENGKLATRILFIMGYMKKSHYVEVSFLEAVTNRSFADVEKAIDILHKYSLVVKHKRTYDYILTVIISRLFQPVIRYNGKNEENEVLRSILSTNNGFLDYKLISYVYSSKSLQNEFPEIRAQLIDQPLLEALVEDKNYTEATELSARIHSVMRKPETLFNHAKCMEAIGNVTEVLEILKCLRRNINSSCDSDCEQPKDFNGKGIANIINRHLNSNIINGYLLQVYLNEGSTDKSLETLHSGKEFTIQYSNKVLHNLIRLLNSSSIPQKYHLKWEYHHRYIFLRVGAENTTLNKIELNFYPLLNRTIEFPNNLQHLILNRPNFFNQSESEKISEFDISHLVGPNLKKFHLGSHSADGKLNISLHKLTHIPEINLNNDITVLLDKNNKISPSKLELEEVDLFVNGNISDRIVINDFVNFKQISDLKLLKYSQGKSRNMKINLTDFVAIDTLHLADVEVLDWKKASWDVKHLYLRDMTYLEKTNMNITTLETKWSTIDPSVLPETIENLTLMRDTNLHPSGTVNLPKLKYLYFDSSYNLQPPLSLFSNCTQLKYLEFQMSSATINASDVPESVTYLKSQEIVFEDTEQLNLDTLNLKWYYTNWDIPSNWKPKHLIFNLSYFIDANERMDDLMILFDRFPKVTLGQFMWKSSPFENSNFSSLVDRKAEYYTFENKKGKAIDETTFKNLLNIP